MLTVLKHFPAAMCPFSFKNIMYLPLGIFLNANFLHSLLLGGHSFLCCVRKNRKRLCVLGIGKRNVVFLARLWMIQVPLLNPLLMRRFFLPNCKKSANWFLITCCNASKALYVFTCKLYQHICSYSLSIHLQTLSLRWVAAKRLALIVQHLPVALAQEVTLSVIHLLQFANAGIDPQIAASTGVSMRHEEACNGACLALAELVRKGLFV